MIFVDHVTEDPLAKLTYHMLGFSDAAEIFVFISGLVCGIAYSRMLERKGAGALLLAIAKRAGRLYAYYAVSSIAIILLVIAAVRYRGLQETFGIMTEHPLSEVASALLLISPPELSGILVLYIVLTLVVVPALLLLDDRYRNLSLAVSGVVWFVSQLCSEYMMPLTHRLFLNPFAWQFLFAIGMTLGMRQEHGRSELLHPRIFRWALLTAWAVVIAAFIYRIVAAHSGFDVASLRLDPATTHEMKENLAALRLLHFLSMALLVSVYLRRDSPILEWTVTKLAIKTGMHSLEVFSLSVVLTVVANIVVLTSTPTLGDRLAIDIIAFALMAFTAAALAYRRRTVVRQHG